MTVCGYARVSTSAQAGDCDSLNQQIDRLKKAGAKKIYVDIQSGKSDTRKEFNRLLGDVTKGLVTEIIVTRIDRLGRSMVSACRSVEIIKSKHVLLRVLDAPIDINTAFGNFSFQQLAALAELESGMLGERVKHGMRFFREQKKTARAPFGYLKKDGRLIPDTTPHPSGLTIWEIAREIVDKLLAGCTANACSNYLLEKYNIKLTGTGITAWLKIPSLYGHTGYFVNQSQKFYRNKNLKPEITHDTHQALLSEQEKVTIFKILSSNRRNFSKHSGGQYPLLGLLRCGECGGSMYRQIIKSGKEYTRCSKHVKMKAVCTNKKCTPLQDVQREVIVQIRVHANQILKLAFESASQDSDIEPTGIVELREQLATLKKLNQENQAIASAIQTTEIQLENALSREATKSVKVADDFLELAQQCSQAAFWASLDDEFLRSTFERLISKVSVDSAGDVTVEFLF